ncbi:hypothetical protein NUW58_g10421 [Xylaria curta]|uniref:Uncharacterized protein n=1 Tax=Xylaria curta TaxID=42375 RepID=A0ACC1ML36_9PEZI|nr:hypothetical protein NUW58_g10421 [Xylaria curta]
MKDGGMLRKREESLAASEDATESPGNLATSIEALLDHQREPPTVSEGRSNIQDLRPKTEKVLSEKDFRKLQGLLADGFLSAQLRDYIQWHKYRSRPESPKAPMSSLEPPEPPEPPEFGWMEEISPWVPLQTQPNDAKGTDLTLQGYVSATTQPKEKLAIRLMRECWGLSIAELQTQLGETRVKLRTNEFLLLMRGTQRFVGGLGKIWLEPGEKIEAIRSQRTLRLVTARHKAESLIDNLHKTLRSVATKTFPVRLVASEVPDANVLEELGRITNTHIRLHVDWIELESRADLRLKTLEDLGHIVFRLLLTALQPRQATSDLLSPTVSQTNPGRLIVDTTNKDKLPWKDRLAQWARFVYPLAPEESAANLQLPIQKLELPFEPLKQTEVSPDPKFPIKWSGVLQTSTVAHFGQVLHSYQPSNPTPFLPDLLSSTDRRLFTPTIPHPLHLARFGPTYSDISKSEVTTKSTLVLRFWPSPSTASPSKNGTTLPRTRL